MREAIERILPTDSPIELLVLYIIGVAAIWYVYSLDFKRTQRHIAAARWSLLAPVLVSAWSIINGGDPAHISYLEMSMIWLAYLTVVGVKWIGPALKSESA